MTVPATTLSSVDLPAPLLPTTVTNSPARNTNETPSRAGRPSTAPPSLKVLVIPLSRSMATGAGPPSRRGRAPVARRQEPVRCQPSPKTPARPLHRDAGSQPIAGEAGDGQGDGHHRSRRQLEVAGVQPQLEGGGDGGPVRETARDGRCQP